MGKAVAALAALAVVFAGFASTASGFVGGGRKPSEAPLIAVGQHYTGELNNHKSDANYEGSHEVALWRLPSVETHDLIVVSWHELPFAQSSDFPICMILAQHLNDYNWGTVFGQTYDGHYGTCYGEGHVNAVSGSGTAQSEITVSEGDPNSSFLEFYTYSSEETASNFESYPYDFTVSGPLHYLSAAISPAEHVRVNGTVSAAVTKADGSPAPDGLAFTLTASKDGEGIATYTATTAGGHLTFQLALSETLVKEDVEFVVTRGADGTYQAVESAKMETQMAKAAVPPAPEPSSACKAAKSRAHALARSLHRLRVHAVEARSWRLRKRLHRQARHVAHKLASARGQAAALC